MYENSDTIHLQALQYRIWYLGLDAKNPYKSQIQAFEAKLAKTIYWSFTANF